MSRNTLKGYFEEGDEPTADQIAELIDESVNLPDDSAGLTGNVIIKNVNHPMYGQTIEGCIDIVDFIKKVFIPFLQAAISINGNEVIEKQRTTTITINGVFTRNDENDGQTSFITLSIESPASSGTKIYSETINAPLPETQNYSHDDINVLADKTYNTILNYQRDGVDIEVVSSTKFVYVVVPYLCGVNATVPGSSIYALAGVTKLVIQQKVAGQSLQVYFSAVLKILYFSYPTAYGLPNQIIDNNGFEQSFGAEGSGEDWEYKIVSVNSGYWTENMYIFFQGPTSVDGYFTFKW